MSRFSFRWHRASHRPPLGLPRCRRARRSAQDEPAGADGPPAGPPAGPPPTPPPPVPQPPVPQPPAGPSARQQKITLYVSGGLVVLIVLLIIALSSGVTRRALDYVPLRQTAVDVVHMPRVLGSELYRKLLLADHPIALHLVAIEENYDIRLKDEVSYLVDADKCTILIGRFRPGQLREAYELGVEAKAKNATPARRAPAEIKTQEGEIDGRQYLYYDQDGVDYAFAALGSSVVCFGDTLAVRRFLRARANREDRVLDDPNFAAVYDRSLARDSLFFRLEKPDGDILGGRLKDLLGDTRDGLRAAFYAIAASDGAVDLTLRFVCRNTEAAERLQGRLADDEADGSLQKLIGYKDKPNLSRDDATVALRAVVPMSAFEEIIETDKKDLETGRRRNLVILLLDKRTMPRT